MIAGRWTSFPAACVQVWARPEFARRNAFEFNRTTVTYAEFARKVSSTACGLKAAGIGRGDLVAVAMERSLEAVVTIYSVIFAGACPCPLEPKLSVQEMDIRFASVGINWIVYDAANTEYAQDLALPEMRKVPAEMPDRGLYMDEGLTLDDPALLLFTSGSTGRPKGVLLSHGNLLANADGVIAHTGLMESDRLLHTMPIYHTNALNNQLFAPLLAGSTVLFADRFKASEIPALLSEYRPTIMTGVPTMYSRLLDQRFDEQSLTSLRMARCGSAPITEELHRKVEEKLGCQLVVSYGLSEATCTSLMNPPGSRKVGTVGTVLKGQTVRLLKPDSLDKVAVGREGEIAIAGPSLMSGYLGRDIDDNRGVQGGWLRTGDLGRFDAEGYLTITGRLKEVIVRGGENISPLAIESLIMTHPAVEATCVVGQPHADLGEIPVAFVVATGNVRPNCDEIRDVVSKSLSRIYRPAAIYFIDKLPETSVGKVDRKALAALAKSHMA
jgi:acyl-CoA synthetase (AMP-forming)/AMP-acid ligase II